MRATPRVRKCCRCATLVSHERRFFSTAVMEVLEPLAEEVPVAGLPVAVDEADLVALALAVVEEEEAAAAPATVLDTDAHHCGV